MILALTGGSQVLCIGRSLQMDESGNVLSTDVTQPFGPRICADAVKDEFATLDQVNTVASKIAFDATTGVVKAPQSATGYQTGELYTTELKSGVDARVVRPCRLTTTHPTKARTS
jgi:hypothetical protein